MRVWHGGVHIHEHWLFQDTKNHSVFEGELTHTDPDMVDLFINVFIFFEDVFVFLVHVEPEICV